jgi:peptide deformylase
MARKPSSPDPQDNRPRLMNDPLAWIDAAPTPSPSPVAASLPAAAAPKAETKPIARPKRSVPRATADQVKTETANQPAETHAAWDGLQTFQVFEFLSNPMMVADHDMIVRFVNEAAFSLFERIEDDIRQELPDFRARELVGKKFDPLVKTASNEIDLLDGTKARHEGQSTIGGAHLTFCATPKRSDDGSIGYVFVEWRDRTTEVKTAEELSSVLIAVRDMSHAQMKGDIGVRIDTAQFRAELRDTLALINDIVNDHAIINQKVVTCVTQMVQGNLDAPIEVFSRQRAYLNDAIELIRGSLKSFDIEIKRLMRDMNQMAAAQKAGDIDHFIDASSYSPSYAEVVSGVNSMVEDHISTKRKALACMMQFANGNFDAPVERFPRKKAFINAKILKEEGELWSFNEGCLSIPNVREDVSRHERITVQYQDEDFNIHTEVFDGLTARVIQHEYDHIEGVLFTDRIASLKKQLIKKKLQNIMEGKTKADYKMRIFGKKGR